MQKYSFFVVCTIFLLIFHAFWRRLPCILFLDNCILAPFVGHSEDLPAWHMQRSKNAKTYCTLLPKSPEKHHSDICPKARKPSKILTRHRVPSRRDFGKIFTLLPSCVGIPLILILAANGWNHRILPQKLQKLRRKIHKMPCSGTKTSDFFDTNIRTFKAKHPYFVAKKSDVSAFPPGNGTKIPFSRFCDISGQGKAWWLPKPFSAR